MLNTEVEYKSDFRFSNAYTKMKSASERSKTKCRSQCQSDGLLQLIQIENIQLGTEYIMFTIHHYTGNLFFYIDMASIRAIYHCFIKRVMVDQILQVRPIFCHSPWLKRLSDLFSKCSGRLYFTILFLLPKIDLKWIMSKIYITNINKNHIRM